jgi:hypothetical protein
VLDCDLKSVYRRRAPRRIPRPMSSIRKEVPRIGADKKRGMTEAEVKEATGS